MCYKCGKLKHYKSVCRSKSVVVWLRVQEEEHDQNLLAVLRRIQEAGYTLYREKCKFSKSSIDFWAKSWTQKVTGQIQTR